MKRIIEIEEKYYEAACKTTMSLDGAMPIYQAIRESKPVDTSGDLISREALKKEVEGLVVGGAEGLKDYYENGSKADENSWIGGVYDTYELINNAPPAPERQQGEWVRKEDVIHSIATQYSEHNELVPVWLSIGNMKGGAE